MVSEGPNKRPRLEGEARYSTSDSFAPDVAKLHDLVFGMDTDRVRQLLLDAAIHHPSVARSVEHEAEACRRTTGRETSTDSTMETLPYRDYFGLYSERVTEIFGTSQDGNLRRKSARKGYLPSSEIIDMFRSMDNSVKEWASYDVKRSAIENMRKILTTIMTTDSIIGPDVRRKTGNMEEHFIVVLKRFDQEDTHELLKDFDGKWRDRLLELQDLAEQKSLFPKLKKAIDIFDAAVVASARYFADDGEPSAAGDGSPAAELVDEVPSDSDDEPVFLRIVEPSTGRVTPPSPRQTVPTPSEPPASRVPDINFDHYRTQVLSRFANERRYGNNYSNLDGPIDMANEIGFIFKAIARQATGDVSYNTIKSAIDTMTEIMLVLVKPGEYTLEGRVAQYTRDLEDYVEDVVTQFDDDELVLLRQECGGRWLDKLTEVCNYAARRGVLLELSGWVDYIRRKTDARLAGQGAPAS